MTRGNKKKAAESVAEKFMDIDNLKEKSMAIMCLNAYFEGKAAGKQEERAKWQKKRLTTT